MTGPVGQKFLRMPLAPEPPLGLLLLQRRGGVVFHGPDQVGVSAAMCRVEVYGFAQKGNAVLDPPQVQKAGSGPILVGGGVGLQLDRSRAAAERAGEIVLPQQGDAEAAVRGRPVRVDVDCTAKGALRFGEIAALDQCSAQSSERARRASAAGDRP